MNIRFDSDIRQRFRFGAAGLAACGVLLTYGCFGTNGGLTFSSDPPVINSFTANGAPESNGADIPAVQNEQITFVVNATDPHNDQLTYDWQTSVGPSPTTSPSASAASTPGSSVALAETTFSRAASPSATPTPVPTPSPTPTLGASTSNVFYWTAPAVPATTYAVTCVVINSEGRSVQRTVYAVVP